MYIPKSQITPNLYTNGEEYVLLSNKENYIGYYHKLSTGEYYTGKNPNDAPVVPLVVFTPIVDTDKANISRISGLGIDPDPVGGTELAKPWNTNEYLISQDKNPLDYDEKFIPSYYYPQVTSEDYDIGLFTRYFAKKANQNTYIEINKDQYNNLKK